ncbi:MAG: hypothetical protein R3E75_06830 [Steroidobacteraceae bacterium]|nr:hypothetical protein [Nevskiaceae bacterium]MCP5339282.1 hypothetical protein [Nevskiaceae bacterium]MCP5359368.1 hypothetical protein [Nevskiaceae bacterium]MCP5470806.1 hypothetical protein [Nevskiaceae bacterium]
MRVTDDRYSRDRLRYDLALRLIRHEARTQTIRQWTGLTDDRIRKLYRSYVRSGGGSGACVRRHRGKSPRQVSFFARSRLLQQDTSCLIAVFSMFGVLPAQRLSDAPRTLPNVTRGELLCDAYETYRRITHQPQISFEHAAFLAVALATGSEIRLQSCRHCKGLGFGDPLTLRAVECLSCGAPLRPAPSSPPPTRRLAAHAGPGPMA